MSKSRKPFNLAEGKIQAAILLKSFRSNEPVKAAKRFQHIKRKKEKLDLNDSLTPEKSINK